MVTWWGEKEGCGAPWQFDADGTALRGWLYAPEGARGPAPVVVMAHVYSAVKEMYLDRYAEVFADAGLAVLVYDNRNFGASDGAPRLEIDPVAQMRDYRHTITYARTLPEVDRERVGVWGRATRAGTSWSSARSTGGSPASSPGYRP
jgi:uncharacterized protein